jgi:hypothetical protein
MLPTPIEVSADTADWNSDDTIVFRNFLTQTPTGKKLIPKMLESTPALLSGGDTNAICIRNGEVRGVNIIARALLHLAFPPPAPQVRDDNYPDPADDKLWDGEKINTNPEPGV